MRPSPLYRNLGITVGELLAVYVDGLDISSQISELTMSRGGADLSSYSPATATLKTTNNLRLVGGKSLSVTVHNGGPAQAIAAATGTSWDRFIDRWLGRVATQTAHDTGQGRKGTTLTSSAWSAVLSKASDTWTPPANAAFSDALSPLCQPQWGAVIPAPVWLGDSDTWPAGPNDPITAAAYIRLLQERLYLLADQRSGSLTVTALTAAEAAATTAATTKWPLARAHTLSPTNWEQPSEFPTRFILRRTSPTGTRISAGFGATGLPEKEVDWQGPLAVTDQWRRWSGVQRGTADGYWRLPTLTARIDRLIASPHEDHRRAAGMLLSLDVSDPVPLAGDWPDGITGIHFCTGLTEQITPQGWTITAQLTPHINLAGVTSPQVKPRTWDQTRLAWNTPPQDWNEGPTS